MKCPLTFKIVTTGYLETKTDAQDCLQAECAWWNEHFLMCSQAVDAYHEGVLDRARERDLVRKGG